MSNNHNDFKKGIAGKIAEAFANSKLTPVIAVVSILLGIGSVILTPKEEEPQISVPMVDILTPVPGYEAEEVERRVTEVIERAVWGLDGVEYVYSGSRPHGSLVTVRFKVGEPMEPSLVKVHHKLLTIKNELPAEAMPSQVKSFSIDDVPFLTLTFHSKKRNDHELRLLVSPLARELSSTPELSRVDMLGGRKKVVRVIVDPAKAASRGVSISDIHYNLKMNHFSAPAGKNWNESEVFDVEIHGRLSNVNEVKGLAVGQRGGAVVRVGDVATVTEGPEERTKVSYLLKKDDSKIHQVSGNTSAKDLEAEPAVSIVFTKRKGANVVILASDLIERAQVFSKTIPDDITMTVTRDYGKTSGEKSMELIEHLVIATVSVAILIAIAMGWRSSLIVSIAIPVTLALTLAIYYFMGYTLNRVTLFALIFSIGILVDDAIVVVENIERHLRQSKNLSITKATIRAVSEVGDPTILATITVIAAILPMAFVRGLMGPYMKPIPVGASMAMILSLFVAFIVTPWASIRFLKKHDHAEDEKEGKMARLFRSIVTALLKRKTYALGFGALSVVLLLLAMSFFLFKGVRVKMLPFDNKEEFQVLIDFPVTTPLAETAKMSAELSQRLLENPDVRMIQIYAGEPAPFSFSGMVKHTFLRKNDAMSDLQVVLTEKHDRSKSSHEIIESLRPVISQFAKEKNAFTRVLEIPPGPPVMATMVAEIYGPTKEDRLRVAKEIYSIFAAEKSVVDLDYSWRPLRPRLIYRYDQTGGGLLGARAQYIVGTGHLLFSETPVVSLADAGASEDVTVDLSASQQQRSGKSPFKGTSLASFETGIVNVEQVLKNTQMHQGEMLMRKNLKPVNYVMSELSGEEEAPVYGILKLSPQIKYSLQTADVPWNTQQPVVKWDGEWFITYEVFRDLGGAFAVVLVLIYVLVLGWFKSYSVPLVIMTPIPISLIGIIPAHAAFQAYFTATSMIGFIAGAGIIVRNSIIMVDFIEQEILAGVDLFEAVVKSGVQRFRPMLLTAAAVVVGSSVILFDPIFQGLAISLMFGSVAAIILTPFAVPVLYFYFIGNSRVRKLLKEKHHSELHEQIAHH